jgi:hypothetical protein
MKLVSVISILGAMALSTTTLFAQEEEKKVILDLEQTWIEANQKHDGNPLERLLRDDFIDIDQDGTVRSARDLYQSWEKMPEAAKAAAAKIKPAINAIRVRLYNAELAVVTGGITLPGPKMNAYRFVRVWTKVNGEWRLSTCQATHVANIIPVKTAPVKIVPTAQKSH